MASLKEVKTRMASVESTKKITQARQMISSAQLHRSQELLAKAAAYRDAVESVVADLQDPLADERSPYLDGEKQGAVAVIMLSSNSGMCGAFNAKMVKEMHNIGKRYPGEEVVLIPVGKKIRDAARQSGIKVDENYDQLAGKMEFGDLDGFIGQVSEMFLSGQVKRVDVIYYHLKSLGTQIITQDTLLPCTVQRAEESNTIAPDFILEPSLKEIEERAYPQLVKARFYHMLMDHQTSEHAARMLAMQMATENADNLTAELQQMYNKLRQANITSELLDIIGGSFA